MRILIVTPIFPPTIGGPATYLKELLVRLPPQIPVKVLTFGEGQNPNVTFISTKGGLIFRQLKFFLTALKLGIDCDLFYLQEPAVVGLSGLIAAKILGKKAITKYVGDPAWEKLRRDKKNPGPLEDFLLNAHHKSWLFFTTKFVLTNSDRIITPAKYLKNLLSKAYGHSASKIQVIPNSVSKINQKNTKIKNSAIVVGRLVNWKNIDLILQAVQIVQKTIPGLKLTIIGDGPEDARLKKLKSKNTLFLGNLSQEKTLEHISENEVLILFSDYEGLPHVAIEAQSQGTVVVASNIPGTDEVVIDRETGILVEPKNIESLAKNIKILLESPSLRAKLSKKAVNYVEKHFLWQKNIKLLTRVFNEAYS